MIMIRFCILTLSVLCLCAQLTALAPPSQTGQTVRLSLKSNELLQDSEPIDLRTWITYMRTLEREGRLTPATFCEAMGLSRAALNQKVQGYSLENLDNYILFQGSGLQQAASELFSNAIDAVLLQRGHPTIGRYGMGFFQILEQLQTKQDHLIFTSVKDGQQLTLDLFKYQGQLSFTYKEAKADRAAQGTTVKLLKPSLTAQAANELRADIEDKYLDEDRVTRSYDGDASKDVSILAQQGEVIVTDRGTGMDRDVIFHSLLRPRRGTKAEQHGVIYPAEVVRPRANQAPPIEPGNQIEVRFLINRVRVKTVTVKDVVTHVPQAISIDLPANAWIPESRDTIEFDEAVLNSLYRMVQNLMEDQDNLQNRVLILNGVAAALRSELDKKDQLDSVRLRLKRMGQEFVGRLREHYALVPNTKAFHSVLQHKTEMEGQPLLYLDPLYFDLHWGPSVFAPVLGLSGANVQVFEGDLGEGRYFVDQNKLYIDCATLKVIRDTGMWTLLKDEVDTFIGYGPHPDGEGKSRLSRLDDLVKAGLEKDQRAVRVAASLKTHYDEVIDQQLQADFGELVEGETDCLAWLEDERKLNWARLRYSYLESYVFLPALQSLLSQGNITEDDILAETVPKEVRLHYLRYGDPKNVRAYVQQRKDYYETKHEVITKPFVAALKNDFYLEHLFGYEKSIYDHFWDMSHESSGVYLLLNRSKRNQWIYNAHGKQTMMLPNKFGVSRIQWSDQKDVLYFYDDFNNQVRIYDCQEQKELPALNVSDLQNTFGNLKLSDKELLYWPLMNHPFDIRLLQLATFREDDGSPRLLFSLGLFRYGGYGQGVEEGDEGLNPDQGIPIFIRTPEGASISIGVDQGDDVARLKRKLIMKMGGNVDDPQLVFAGKILDDRLRAGKIGLTGESTLQLVVRGTLAKGQQNAGSLAFDGADFLDMRAKTRKKLIFAWGEDDALSSYYPLPAQYGGIKNVLSPQWAEVEGGYWNFAENRFQEEKPNHLPTAPAEDEPILEWRKASQDPRVHALWPDPGADGQELLSRTKPLEMIETRMVNSSGDKVYLIKPLDIAAIEAIEIHPQRFLREYPPHLAKKWFEYEWSYEVNNNKWFEYEWNYAVNALSKDSYTAVKGFIQDTLDTISDQAVVSTFKKNLSANLMLNLNGHVPTVQELVMKSVVAPRAMVMIACYNCIDQLKQILELDGQDLEGDVIRKLKDLQAWLAPLQKLELDDQRDVELYLKLLKKIIYVYRQGGANDPMRRYIEDLQDSYAAEYFFAAMKDPNSKALEGPLRWVYDYVMSDTSRAQVTFDGVKFDGTQKTSVLANQSLAHLVVAADSNTLMDQLDWQAAKSGQPEEEPFTRAKVERLSDHLKSQKLANEFDFEEEWSGIIKGQKMPHVFVRETVQNARDAVQSLPIEERAKKERKKVEILPVADEANKQMGVMIRDYVGIKSLKKLVKYMLRYDSSDKVRQATALSEQQLGMFGKGLYSIFDGADEVRIVTGVDGVVMDIVIGVQTYIGPKGNQLLRLTIKNFDRVQGAQNKDGKAFTGTLVQRLTKYDHVDQDEMKHLMSYELFKMQVYAQQYLSSFHSDEVDIYYGQKSMNKHYEEVSQTTFALDAEHPKETIRVLLHDQRRDFPTSKLTVGGAFLQNLRAEEEHELLRYVPAIYRDFLFKHVGGVMIDLPKSVQLLSSRTGIKQAQKESLQRAVAYAVIQSMMSMYIRKNLRFPGLPEDLFYTPFDDYETSNRLLLAKKIDLAAMEQGDLSSIVRIKEFERNAEVMTALALNITGAFTDAQGQSHQVRLVDLISGVRGSKPENKQKLRQILKGGGVFAAGFSKRLEDAGVHVDRRSGDVKVRQRPDVTAVAEQSNPALKLIRVFLEKAFHYLDDQYHTTSFGYYHPQDEQGKTAKESRVAYYFPTTRDRSGDWRMLWQVAPDDQGVYHPVRTPGEAYAGIEIEDAANRLLALPYGQDKTLLINQFIYSLLNTYVHEFAHTLENGTFTHQPEEDGFDDNFAQKMKELYQVFLRCDVPRELKNLLEDVLNDLGTQPYISVRVEGQGSSYTLAVDRRSFKAFRHLQNELATRMLSLGFEGDLQWSYDGNSLESSDAEGLYQNMIRGEVGLEPP